MFKFTIREAIMATTIVAISLMWWMDRSQIAKYEARLAVIETHVRQFVPPPPPPGMIMSASPSPAGARWVGPPPGANPTSR